MNKKITMAIILIVILLVVCAFVVINFIKKNETKSEELNYNLEVTSDIKVVPTMLDKIATDSAWCGTFQLIWNDLKNELAGQNIVFDEPNEMVDNLNVGDFTTDDLSDDYYYKKWGLKTLELKKEIEEEIYAKFKQKSDILDSFSWDEENLHGTSGHDYLYFLYTMLYRKFEFLNSFDSLEDGMFGKSYTDVQYFGIDSNTNDKIGNQITVLYYNSKDDFAVSISTKNQDEVILCKNPKGDSFNTIYSNITKNRELYRGDIAFKDVDEFKMPFLRINLLKEYDELTGKEFQVAEDSLVGEPGVIQKAIQTIKFVIDEKGGEIKSEAGMSVSFDSAILVEPEKEEPRYFYLDDTFAIFLKEVGRDKPYFAARVSDISKFQ